MESIIDDSAITCDKIIESHDNKTKAIATNFNEEKATLKNYCILLVFLIITIVLLIAVSIYCYLIKYQAKHKHSLPFQFKNNRLKEIIY